MTYLLTFNCYGTRLPGDQRGTVDRIRGRHRGGKIWPSKPLERWSNENQYSASYVLTQPNAHTVLRVIQDVCGFRGWHLLAAHVRTTHVHVVVAPIDNPDRAIGDFKSYASRKLNLMEGFQCRWARGGSTQPLRTPESVRHAIRYVTEGQGGPMALYVSNRWERS